MICGLGFVSGPVPSVDTDFSVVAHPASDNAQTHTIVFRNSLVLQLYKRGNRTARIVYQLRRFVEDELNTDVVTAFYLGAMADNGTSLKARFGLMDRQGEC